MEWSRVVRIDNAAPVVTVGLLEVEAAGLAEKPSVLAQESGLACGDELAVSTGCRASGEGTPAMMAAASTRQRAGSVAYMRHTTPSSALPRWSPTPR
jgi:hypothetical protein